MTHQTEQPEPAKPSPGGPVWRRYASQMNDRQFHALLTAREKASEVTPGLQRALTAVSLAAAVATVAAVAVFLWSHFRAMDVQSGLDAAGNRTGFQADYTVAGIVLIAFGGVLLALAGTRLDVTARTRAVLMASGGGVMMAVGAGAGLLLDPSREDLRRHYHVGEWGSQASFERLLHILGAFGWFVAACGLVVVLLMIVQRRKVAAAYDAVEGRRRA